ncbi:MAG: hypothetical protein CM15mP29_1090 [Alphaproteobacteria bacterium]|nr:MAG: hypothetical protein CM15mP29_1090 [Alphaproteobacteria bacterium]
MIKFQEMMEKDPNEVVVNAVKECFQKQIRDVMMKRLKVFSDSSHPFEKKY